MSTPARRRTLRERFWLCCASKARSFASRAERWAGYRNPWTDPWPKPDKPRWVRAKAFLGAVKRDWENMLALFWLGFISAYLVGAGDPLFGPVGLLSYGMWGFVLGVTNKIGLPKPATTGATSRH